MAIARHVRGEFARHRWMAPGLAVTGSAFLGTVLPDLVSLLHRVLP